MIPFLTDLPSLNSSMPATTLLPQPGAPAAGAGSDFALLLGDALPPSAPLAPAPLPETAFAPDAGESASPLPRMALPGGTILPPAGKSLPSELPAASPPLPRKETAGDPPATVPDVTPFAAPPGARLPQAENAAPLLVVTVPEGSGAPDPASATRISAGDEPLVAASPVPPSQGMEQAIVPALAMLSPPPPLAPPPVISPVTSPLIPAQLVLPVKAAPQPPSRTAAAPLHPEVTSVLHEAPASVPALVAEMASGAGDDLGSTAAAPSAPAQAAGAPPQAASPLTPATPAPALQPAPAPDRADHRGALAAPQLESTIAQVGELREALRAARPEMTLHHAEFGFVSLRLEAAGAEGWRAVLASRDPGFVPAIQTALAERALAVAASAEADPSGAQTGGGQHGAGDQRYGASPNGGQGPSQPYSSQSGPRDGEAAPDHRRPSTAAALAERAEEQEAAGSPASRTGGLFA